MFRRLAPILLIAIAPALSGCVAAAVPLAAGLLVGKRVTDENPTGSGRPAVRPSPAASTNAVAMAETEAGAAVAEDDAAPGGAASASPDVAARVAELSSSRVVGVAEFEAPPMPGGISPEASEAFSGLFAAATSVAQRDPFSDEKRLSAFLAKPDSLSPDRTECAFAQTAVLVDLDPGEGEAPLGEDAVAPPQLAQVLATLRAQEIAVLWLSRHTADRAGAVRRALLRTGLDPRGSDELYLVRYEDESKITRRADAAKDFCIVAILGDEKQDFDALFGFLKNPDEAFALDPLLGKAWFLGPPPLTSNSNSQQG
mgnify:CR=1 FL=1